MINLVDDNRDQVTADGRSIRPSLFHPWSLLSHSLLVSQPQLPTTNCRPNFPTLSPFCAQPSDRNLRAVSASSLLETRKRVNSVKRETVTGKNGLLTRFTHLLGHSDGAKFRVGSVHDTTDTVIDRQHLRTPTTLHLQQLPKSRTASFRPCPSCRNARSLIPLDHRLVL